MGTNSDFAKLAKIIKNGKIPRDNWHGKGKEYETAQRDKSESSVESKSESSDNMDHLLPINIVKSKQSQQQRKKGKPKGKNSHFAMNKSVPLDGDELSNKLKRLRNDRTMIREKQNRKLQERKKKKYNQYSQYHSQQPAVHSYHHPRAYLDYLFLFLIMKCSPLSDWICCFISFG